MYPSLKLYVHHYFIYGFGGKATSHSKFLTCSKNRKGSLKLQKKVHLKQQLNNSYIIPKSTKHFTYGLFNLPIINTILIIYMEQFVFDP